MSKKLYILFILLVCMQWAVEAQTTVIIFADSALGKTRSIKAYAASGITFQDDSILVNDQRGYNDVTNIIEHGYSVFDLAAAGIPAGATITSARLGYYVGSLSGTAATNAVYYINGVVGDLSSNSDTLNMLSILKHDKLASSNTLFAGSGSLGFGLATGNQSITIDRNLSWLSNHASGKVSLVFAQRSVVNSDTRRYGIVGYTGNNTSTTSANHRPYLTITFTAPSACSGAPLAGSAKALPSAGNATTFHAITLSGATMATGLTYQWQSAATETGTYSNITGATDRSYSFSGVTATRYYRCAITCSGSTSYSAPTPVFLINSFGCLQPLYTNIHYANYVLASSYPMGFMGMNVTITGDSSTVIEDSTVSSPLAYNNMCNAPCMQGLIFYKGYRHLIQMRSAYHGQNWTGWMDYNNNGTFESTEYVGGENIGTTIGGVSNDTLDMVPTTLADGYYRLRIVGVYSTSSPIACPISYGEGMVRDFLVKVASSNPVLSSSVSSIDFGSIARGSTSSNRNCIVTGRFLVLDTGRLTMTVNAPFELSRDRTTWSTTLSRSYTARAYNDSVFIRCRPTTLGALIDTIRITGGGFAGEWKLPTRVFCNDSCFGLPSAGTTISSHTVVSPYISFLLSLRSASRGSGLAYQWQYSTTGTSGSWIDISGAIDSVHEHTELRRNTFFRCKVRCISSGSEDSSIPFRVNWTNGIPGCLRTDTIPSISCTSFGMVLNGLRINGSEGYLADSSRCNIYGYNDRTNLVLKVESGNSYTAQMTTGSTYGISVQYWIDFNANGTFESTETVGGLASAFTATRSCTLTIPSSVRPGTFRMRVFTSYSSPIYPSINPCGGHTYGVAKDYTVVVTGGFVPGNIDFGYRLIDTVYSDSSVYFYANNLSPDSGYIRFRAPTNFGVSISDTVFRAEDSIYYRSRSVPLTRIKVHFLPRTTLTYNGILRATGGGLDTTIQLRISGIGQFTRCSGYPGAGVLSCAVTLADDTTNIPIIHTGCDTNGGIEKAWQYSTDSITWLNIPGALFDTINYRGITQKSFFRRSVYCYYSGTYSYSNVVVVHYPHRVLTASATRTACYDYTFNYLVNSSLLGMKLVTNYGDGTTDTIALTSARTYAINHVYSMSGIYTIRYRLYKLDTLYDSGLFSQEVIFCNTIRIRNFYDVDSNCIKATSEDLCVFTSRVKVDSAGYPIDTIAYIGSLNYSAYGPIGTVYRFTPIFDTTFWRIPCLSGGSFLDTLQAGGFYPIVNYVPVKELPALWDFSVNTEGGISRIVNSRVRIYSQRLIGPDTLTANVKYRISPRTRIYASSPAPSSISSDSLEYTWNYTSFRYELIYLSIRRDTGLFTLGDTFYSAGQIGPLARDVRVSNNFENRCDSVRASYDPNYIESDPAGCITSGITTEYTVGFENTGSDTAYNVHILDTLSGYLDPRTLEPTMSSHPMVLETRYVAGMTIVKFDFPNIKLLDSSQPHGNHGMFKYKIRVRSGLADGTLISSRVGIYFDDNDVVMTNTQVNTINCPVYVSYPTVESVGGARVGGTLGADNLIGSNDLKVYPNPVNDELHIEATLAQYDECVVTNTMGKVIWSSKLHLAHQMIPTKQWPSGIYFVQVKGTMGAKTVKLVKQ